MYNKKLLVKAQVVMVFLKQKSALMRERHKIWNSHPIDIDVNNRREYEIGAVINVLEKMETQICDLKTLDESAITTLEQDNARMREALELIQELGMAVASREPFICPGSIEHHIQEIIKKTRKALNQN
jgi:TPP-dependent indolepyruvate ferredoxin oxidoreductase alpha subunit